MDIKEWNNLKKDFKHLLECPDKGREVKILFDRGQDYMKHHGKAMFISGFISGMIVLTVILVLLKILYVDSYRG